MFVSYNWIYSDKKLLKTYFHFRQTSPTEQKWELGGVHAFAGSRLVGVCKKIYSCKEMILIDHVKNGYIY